MVYDLKGSKELKKGLPHGALVSMAAVFGNAPDWISRVVSGKNNGNPKIIECANKLADVEFDKKQEIEKILDDYKTTM